MILYTFHYTTLDCFVLGLENLCTIDFLQGLGGKSSW